MAKYSYTNGAGYRESAPSSGPTGGVQGTPINSKMGNPATYRQVVRHMPGEGTNVNLNQSASTVMFEVGDDFGKAAAQTIDSPVPTANRQLPLHNQQGKADAITSSGGNVGNVFNGVMDK